MKRIQRYWRRFAQAYRVARTPNARVYNWREVEEMRESLARYGGALSRSRAYAIRSHGAVSEMTERLKAMQELAREANDYATADSLRSIIEVAKNACVLEPPY